MKKKNPKFDPKAGIIFGPEGDFTADIERMENTPLTPKQQEISDVASAAIKEVEDIFEGQTFTRNGKTYTRSALADEDVDFVLSLVEETGLSRVALRDKIMSVKPGQYFVAQSRAFFMTGDFKVQEAAAYVNRLEKATITAFKGQNDWQAKCIAAELGQRKAERDLNASQEEIARLKRPGLVRRALGRVRRLFKR